MRKQPPVPADNRTPDGERFDDYQAEVQREECETSVDPKVRAREVTAPIIESMRERFKNIDVSKYRKAH